MLCAGVYTVRCVVWPGFLPTCSLRSPSLSPKRLVKDGVSSVDSESIRHRSNQYRVKGSLTVRKHIMS